MKKAQIHIYTYTHISAAPFHRGERPFHLTESPFRAPAPPFNAPPCINFTPPTTPVRRKKTHHPDG